MMTSILAIVASVVGVAASWYLGRVVLKWRQARAIERQLAESVAAALHTGQMNHQTQDDLDHLDEIERRERGDKI